MMMIPAQMSKKRLVPLAATFAALYGLLRLMPIFLMIGGAGRAFSTTEFVAPLLGIILGPCVGSIAGVIGTFLGIMLTGRMNFFGLDFLPIMMNAGVLGLLMQRRRIPAIALYSALIVLFFAHPSTLHLVAVSFLGNSVAIPFVWLHIITWILLVSPLGTKSAGWISGTSEKKRLAAACILSLIGSTAQQLTGTLLFASMAVPLMGMTAKALEATWAAVFYTYPIERLGIILPPATVVTAAVAKAFQSAGLFKMANQTTQ